MTNTEPSFGQNSQLSHDLGGEIAHGSLTSETYTDYTTGGNGRIQPKKMDFNFWLSSLCYDVRNVYTFESKFQVILL